MLLPVGDEGMESKRHNNGYLNLGVYIMSLIRSKNGTWIIRFMVDKQIFQKSSRSKNKTKALEIERKFRQEVLDKKMLGTKDAISLYEALDKFDGSKISMKSYPDISNKIRGLKSYFDDKPIHEITTADVEHYVLTRRQEGRAAQTIDHGIIQLRGCIEYMSRLDYQVPDIKYPRIKVDNARVRFLEKECELKLLAELEPKNPKYFRKIAENSDNSALLKQRQDNYDLVILLLDVGARYGELSSLTYAQIDLENRTILLKRTKTNNETILHMSNRVYQVLKRRSENKAHPKWIFTDKSGKNPRKHSTIAIKRAIKNAGIEDFRIHDFRHTCASRLVRNGLQIQEVSFIMGHKNITTTTRYCHLLNSEVAEKMKAVIDRFNE